MGQTTHWLSLQGDRVRGNPEMLPQVGFNDLSPEEQSKWAKEMTHSM